MPGAPGRANSMTEGKLGLTAGVSCGEDLEQCAGVG
jgi:hypothetical protein